MKHRCFSVLLLALVELVSASFLYAQDSGGPDQVVAVVNGREITLAEVDSTAGMRLHQLRQKIFQVRQAVLNYLIREILLEEEAKAQGMTLAEYKESLLRTVVVTEAEVDDILQKMYPPEALNNQVLRERVRVRLEANKKRGVLNAKGEELQEAAQVEINLTPPAPPTVQLDNGEREGLGNPNAPVTLVEFGDFQCQHCRAAVPVVREILARYSGRVRYVYRHFPLPHHQWARMAAEASECARDEGKFWEYHDLLFENAQPLSYFKLLDLASSVGLDAKDFERCLMTQRYLPVVEEDIREGRRVGISATPTFFINGRRFSGTPTVEQLQQLIEEALKTAASRPSGAEGQKR
ncbi:MAG: thioredoxin domain-containing protein [Terriglobia bacterium]